MSRLQTISMNQLAARLKQVGEKAFAEEYPHPFLVLVFEPPEEKEEEEESTQQTRQTDIASVMPPGSEATGKRVVPLSFGRRCASERLVVGRQDDSQLVIRAQKVSRRHAAFFQRQGHWWLEDLGSANGTRLNGKRLAPHRPQQLKSGDMVAFWMYLFQFVEQSAFCVMLRSAPVK